MLSESSSYPPELRCDPLSVNVTVTGEPGVNVSIVDKPPPTVVLITKPCPANAAGGVRISVVDVSVIVLPSSNSRSPSTFSVVLTGALNFSVPKYKESALT